MCYITKWAVKFKSNVMLLGLASVSVEHFCWMLTGMPVCNVTYLVPLMFCRLQNLTALP